MDWKVQFISENLDKLTNHAGHEIIDSNVIKVNRKKGELMHLYIVEGDNVGFDDIKTIVELKIINLVVYIKKETVVSGAALEYLESNLISIGGIGDMMRIIGNRNNWPYINPEVKFIMNGLNQHSKVESVKRLNNRKYLIKRHLMKDVVMIPTQDYEVTTDSIRKAYHYAGDAQVILAVNPNRSILDGAYSIAESLNVDLCTWGELLGKLNSKWN